MKEKILIVEDQFVEADYLKMMLEKGGYAVSGIARSVGQAHELIKKERPGFVLLDIFLKGKQTGIDLAGQLSEENIPFVYLSANSNEEVLNAAKQTQPYGFLVKPFRERDLMVTLEIARYRHEQSLESKFRMQKRLEKRLAEIDGEKDSWESKLLKTAKALQQFLSFDGMTIAFKEPENKTSGGLAFVRRGFDEYQTMDIQELSAVFDFDPDLVIPLTAADGCVICLSFFRRLSEGNSNEQPDLPLGVQQSLIHIIGHIPTAAKKKVALPGVEAGMQTTAKEQPENTGFEGIIGKNPAILNMMDLVNQVAQTNTSVLLLGESGTGKERIADCIHHLSLRKGKPFVKVSCAALPSNLIESELFGHEKGAFTGAHERRIGKFERAQGGTILLDEIGEMPIELQAKLLRVLQEREIERIGGKEAIKVDVRIIAATNRTLEKEVADGRFRLDLYYRLNVFPITLPPLRDRKEDIPALTNYFLDYYNRKAGKRISGISEKVLVNMMNYHWPGNIRELEHIIERSVLLAKGAIIEGVLLPAGEKKEAGNAVEHERMKTIHENEREYIISVLKKCNGKIWGSGAAAQVLNIPPSTLQSKMKKLGIKKEYIK